MPLQQRARRARWLYYLWTMSVTGSYTGIYGYTGIRVYGDTVLRFYGGSTVSTVTQVNQNQKYEQESR